MTLLWKNRLKRTGALLLTGALFVPIAAYLIGSYIIGPYEGNGGLAGFLGTIYLSAGRGERAALVLILAPLLIVTVWQIGLWLKNSFARTLP